LKGAAFTQGAKSIVARRGRRTPADLGGEDEVVAPLPAQRLPEPQFGQAVAVHRRGVEEPHAGIPGPRDHRVGGRLVDGRRKLPMGAVPKPKAVTSRSDAAELPSSRMGSWSLLPE
jgi:hypothetical protein